MPLTDRYDNPLSTGSEAARDHYVAGVDLFLGVHFGATAQFAEAVAADPGFALGHIGHARALMMSGDMAGAKAAFARAEALSAGLPERDLSHIACYADLFAGRAADCRARVFAHVQRWPRDALAAQLCTNVFGLIGFSGEVGREAQMLAYTSALLPHYGDDWWMRSMHAISLCETGDPVGSQTLMDASMAVNPHNANGSHFKAHALYEEGQMQAGRAFLDDWITGYDRRSALHGHLTWHAALWALGDQDIDAMWAAIDAGIGPGASEGLPINVLTDTAALLYRAELAGVEVPPERWSDLSDYAARTFPATGQSFADLHAALAHAMAGQGDRLAAIAENAQGFAGDLVRPLAAAWGRMARGKWAEALALLTPVMAVTERLGGSRAQRDLLEFAYLNILLKLGLRDEARRVVAMRRPMFAEAAPVAGFA